MFNPFKPAPAPPAFGQGTVLPEADSSLLSRLLFDWLTPFLSVGFTRPLEKEDLWELPPPHLTDNLTDLIQENFYARCPSEQRPPFLRDTQQPSLSESKKVSLQTSESDHDVERQEFSKSNDADDEKTDERQQPAPALRSWFRWNPKTKKEAKQRKYDSSLIKALHTSFFWRWWLSGFLKFFADTLKTTSPLVTKALLDWLTEAFIYHKSPLTSPKPRGIGYGIGLAFVLFAMQEISSLMTNHFMITTMTTGLLLRTGIIGNIFRKSLRLSGRARLDHSVGQITTMISTDASRLDLSSAQLHNIWVAPIQIIIGVALLINNLGVSALVGFGVLVLGLPVLIGLVRLLFAQRKKGVQITDKRVRLITEVLQGVRLIKFYAWESFYEAQIGTLRVREIAVIRRGAIYRAVAISVVTVMPILASVLSFITYALTGHTLTPAIIFSSLQFFNIIRMPLIQIPVVLASVSDAVVALGRIGRFLTAEELEEPYRIDAAAELAVDADGDFSWETVQKNALGLGSKFEKGAQGAGKAQKDAQEQARSEKGAVRWGKRKKENVLPTTVYEAAAADHEKEEGALDGKAENDNTKDEKTEDENKEDEETEDEKPFELKDLQLKIPRGAFVAIVGRVGSGKSSLLQALTGEMRRTRGNVVFGGNVAYVPQAAWIMNATLRENILFGREDDDKKFHEIVRACSLEHDLDVLPYGDLTEIGEKGINLSGGQKARVSLARAAYSDSDIVLLDDPLSAVDAHVGRAILEDCLLSGPFASKTRVLVTHALHVLPKTDYIYVIDNGVVAEQGTYQRLIKDGQAFSRLMDEYGDTEEKDTDSEKECLIQKGKETLLNGEEPVKKEQQALMSQEERSVGSVPFSVYGQYLRHAGGILWAPFFILLLTLTQGASVGNNLFLGFWTSTSIRGFSQGQYMGVYAALGVAQALFAFVTNFAFSLVGLYASLRMFRLAMSGVLRSPVSFFDTTPVGRILSRLSKDQDTLDTQLSTTIYQFLSTFSNVIGTIALVFYTFPLLGIIFAPLSVLYYVVASFYRRSSVETKRLDSLMRSALYGSYSETLTGLSTVRAYRAQDRFVRNAESGLDLENRAYYMTISIQRWLSVRLDIFGNILILGIALFAAGFRSTVDPSKIGVVLSYTLSITQVFSDLVSQFAQNEQNMNAVERVLVYIDLPPEGATSTADDPPPSWPESGEIKFRNVKLAYREGLPLVLKGVSFAVKPGEKVGIVGRTGAGKSSLLQALFRMVELSGGEIDIDGRNIRNMGLDILRRQLALVPQDSTLFLGTLRENLDPQNTRTDAEIILALRRAWLLPRDETVKDPVADAKFSLDAAVSDEGSNFSAGEKQLLALCRALLKGSRVIILDEATSSVDAETDAKLQQTIQVEFAACTLLCIAHRLNTIVYYDRVLVMDGGRVAEFDTPLNLFDKEDSIFRSLCEEAALSRQDILRIRAGVVMPESKTKLE